MGKRRPIVVGTEIVSRKTLERGRVENIRFQHKSPYYATEYQVRWHDRKLVTWVPARDLNPAGMGP